MHGSADSPESVSALSSLSMGLRHWLTVIGVGGLILVGAGIAWRQLRQDLPLPVRMQGPDAFATQLSLTRFNQQGQLYQSLHAAIAVHNTSKQTVALVRPMFQLFLADQSFWRLSAHRGRWEAGRHVLQLWDEVVLTQWTSAVKQPLATLQTTSLSVYPDMKIAETKALVRWREQNQWVQGMGMQADLAAKTVRLLSQVRAELRPETTDFKSVAPAFLEAPH